MTHPTDIQDDAELREFIESWIPINVKDAHHVKVAKIEARDEFMQLIKQREAAKETTGDLLQRAIDMSGNEFAMGYDDSGCFWRFYYGSRGAGSMMQGWPSFRSESPDIHKALQEFIDHLPTPTDQKEKE